MKNRIVIIFIVLISFVSLYLVSNRTYTAYQSKVDDEILLRVADWNIEVNGQNIATANGVISLDSIEWEDGRVNSGTIAPGSKGTVKIDIDPKDTKVDIKYVLSYIDHTVNEDCILTVTSISSEGVELTKETKNSYSGIITLDQIKKGEVQNIVINVEWINDEDNNENDSIIGLGDYESDIIVMELNAYQYKGE